MCGPVTMAGQSLGTVHDAILSNQSPKRIHGKAASAARRVGLRFVPQANGEQISIL